MTFRKIFNGPWFTRVDRLIMVLYYCEELTEFEIACTLEISEHRIHKLREIIIEKFRKLIKE